MTDDRIHLVVIFGGRSAEHDVSCTTAAHVLRAADPTKYRITPVGISTDGQWAIAEGAAAALAAGPEALPGRLDPSGPVVSPTPMLTAAVTPAGRTVVLPLLHGPLGEDGTVQGMLELADIPYVGSGVLGSAVSMDKAMAKQVALAAGIPQARFRSFGEHELTPGLPAELADDLGLPAFVKPANMGSSVGVSKAHTVEELRDAIDVALGLRRDGRGGGGDRRSRDRGRGARQPRAGGIGARRDRSRRGVLQLRGQVRHRRRPTADPRAPRRGGDRRGARPRAAGVPRAAVRRVWPASTSSTRWTKTAAAGGSS